MTNTPHTFPGIGRDETLPNSSYEASIKFIPKHNKDATNKIIKIILNEHRCKNFQ
jgi:hypothetical protein